MEFLDTVCALCVWENFNETLFYFVCLFYSRTVLVTCLVTYGYRMILVCLLFLFVVCLRTVALVLVYS